MCHHPGTSKTLEQAREIHVRIEHELLSHEQALGFTLTREQARQFRRKRWEAVRDESREVVEHVKRLCGDVQDARDQSRPLKIVRWSIDSCDAVAIRYAFRAVIDGEHNQDIKRECAELLNQLDRAYRYE